MAIPQLKRITIQAEQELDVWLARNSDHHESVMVVTRATASHRHFVSRELVAQLIASHGWKAGRCYTLGSDRLGHVITRDAS